MSSYIVSEKMMERLLAAEKVTGESTDYLIRAAIEAYLKGLGV